MSRTAVSYLVLIGVCLSLYFAFLGRGDLAGQSEGNYAEIPREMLESGDWVIPRLNYVPYLEKPPLFYWATALAYKAFGANAFSARFWSAFPALLLVLSVFAFLRKFRDEETALFSALILAASGGMIAMARISYMDMLLCLCTAWTFLSFYMAEDAPEGARKKLWYSAFFALLGLAVLTKGLIGIVLPGMGIFFYLTAQKRWAEVKRIPWILGIAIFLAIALPWHLFAGVKNDKFFWFYFINEHWLRFLGKRLPKDYYEGPFYYQTLRVLLLFLPWSFLLPLLFVRKVKEFFSDRLNCFLACWFVAFLFFYTISKAKANYYMMPGMPALAMLMGLALKDRVWNWASGKGWVVLTGLLLVAAMGVCATLSVFPYPFLKKLAPGAYPYLLGSAFILTTTLFLCFGAALRNKWKASFGFLIAGITLGSLPLFAHEQIFERRGSVQPLVRLIQANQDPDTMVALRGTFEKNSLLAFYLGKRLAIISEQGDVGGDLDFGARFPEHKPHFIQWQDFLRKFGGKEKILYITYKDADTGELSGNHPTRYYLVARTADRLLIANFPPKTFHD